MRFKSSNVTWGVSLLLVAAFILMNQFSDFTDIGIGSIIAIILALAFIVQCLVRSHFSLLPIPLAVLYRVLQAPLGLPVVRIWPMIAVAVLVYVGLEMLLPRKRRQQKWKQSKVSVKTDDENNPSINVNFGEVNRHLCAAALETARLNCSFGAMEISFDQVELSPDGAEVMLNCSFGSIELFVPGHWHITDQIDCTVGGVDIGKGFASSADNAPRLTLSGKVSFGSIEVRHI